MHTVAGILGKKGTPTNYVTANSTVLKAAKILKEKNRSFLIVRNNNKYVGIISEKDCVYKLIL